MWEHNVEEFITNVCKEIKYKKARNKISEELKNHIEDHAYDLMDNGVDEEVAYMQSIEAMGNPKEIGKNLNKQHRPYVGWLLNITNIIIGMICFFLGFIIILGVIGSFDHSGYPNKNDIKYSAKLKQEDKIDTVTITMKQIILDKNNGAYIILNEYHSLFEKNYWVNNWGAGSFNIYDDLGNKYTTQTGQGSNSMFGSRRNLIFIENLNSKAQKIILDYDHYNRHMRFEIKLSGGDEK